MKIDSPPTNSPQNHIIKRLQVQGVPTGYLEKLQPGLTAYYKDNRCKLVGLVSAILSPNEVYDVENIHFPESMVWLQWLMFEGDPGPVLKSLAALNVSERGVCGAVWGNNDIAYRCITCQHDYTCAICVPCFQNGNHKDHDYSIIYTGSGCCDCGDVTAWKRDGFCSKHKGAEQILPLSNELAISIGPVLDLLFSSWKNCLIVAESEYRGTPNVDDRVGRLKFADSLSTAVVQMLLEFCNCSESLLSFISARVLSSVGLLDMLLKTERFMSDEVVTKLKELLLKLLSEPLFKYEFAKVFLDYYPTAVNEAIREGNVPVSRKYPLWSGFSVQIFTVPTLTPRLVEERNLLVLLLECLENIFVSCAAEDGHLEVNKWGNSYETTYRVVQDVGFVMSHSVVPEYVIRERRDIVKMWIKLLAFMQGMNPLKRQTGIHIEDDDEIVHMPFVIGRWFANIDSLLVAGEFSESSEEEKEDENLFNTCRNYYEDLDSHRHTKVGKRSWESFGTSASERNSILDSTYGNVNIKRDILLDQPVLSCLTNECLKAIERWLRTDNTCGTFPGTAKMLANDVFVVKNTLSKFRRKDSLSKSSGASLINSPLVSLGKLHGRRHSSTVQNVETGDPVGIDMESAAVIEQYTGSAGLQENKYTTEQRALSILSRSDWPDISYDVSSLGISVHVPLHRLLSMILQRAARRCYGKLGSLKAASISTLNQSSKFFMDFFGNILGGCHPCGFSAFIMEHPLRVRVFCAQVHAGMWRKNGDAALLSREYYRSVRWYVVGNSLLESEQGLELDLFLLQCCAALAPADRFVSRFLERFGLSNYLCLNIEESNEYEPVMMQEMLILIIQIVKERRFCGLSETECLQREIIYTLAIGDATHSQLVRSLPGDLSKSNRLQEILDRVAVLSGASVMNQGTYKLRLQYWKQLDLYHPRWNSGDLQKAEERYLQFCQASALTSQLPKWTNIYEPLNGIAGITTCKVVLQIVRAVLFYHIYTNKSIQSRAPDSVLLTTLHLLSLALDICFQQRESSNISSYTVMAFPILAFASEDVLVRHANGSGEESLLSLLVASMMMHRKSILENLVEAGSFNFSSLIEDLLKKLAELDSRCMTKLQKLAPEVVSQLSHSAFNCGTYQGGLVSEVDKRKAKARERQAAILENMRAQQSKFLENANSTATDELDGSVSGEPCPSDIAIVAEESKQDVCSLCHDTNSKDPLCFLIFFQKSRLLSLVDRGPPSWKDNRDLGKEPLPEMSHLFDENTTTHDFEQMSSEQLSQMIQSSINEHPGEVNAFVEFSDPRFPSIKNIHLPNTLSKATERTAISLETFEEQIYLTICQQMRDNLHHSDILEHNHRFPIVDESPENGNPAYIVLEKYIATHLKETHEDTSASETTCSQKAGPSESLKTLSACDAFSPLDCDGIHLSSCGHAVHQACLDRYLSSLKERSLRRSASEGRNIGIPDQGEFLCPVCRGVAITFLPDLPGDSLGSLKQSIDSTMRGWDSTSCMPFGNKDNGKLCLREASSLLGIAANVAGRDEILKSFPSHQIGKISPNLEPVLRLLSGMYFSGEQNKILGSERVNHSIIMWETLKYSLVSTEIASRCKRSSLIPNFTIDSLFKELEPSKSFILSLLLKIAQGAMTKNSLTVLLRLRGIQSFAASICSGGSSDDFASHSMNKKGEIGLDIVDPVCLADNITSMLKKFGREVPYPGRACDPIISFDAFSSLMWVLFCLPSQFLSLEHSFISLVHIFYGVSVAQAILTYFGKFQCNREELGCAGILIREILNNTQECAVARQYFTSNHLNDPCDMKSFIRGLSFPFLRRCALLWKVMSSSTSTSYSDGARLWNGSSDAIDEMMEDVNDNKVEPADVQALEKMFNIPPLDAVLNDEILCSLVSRWLCHFNKKLRFRYVQSILPLNPAVPFKLMHIPNVYQDLLQRYIKQRCPDCNDALKEAALCLLCGKLCSPYWKTCCSKSGCQTHAMTCGASIGVFLLIKLSKTTILLQRGQLQASWPSPYLDAFGEEDVEMHRGKPLYLNEERYASLTYMVASHGFTKVLRHTTFGSLIIL